MRKKSTSLAGFFDPRFVTALVFCSIGVSLALIGFSQTPPLPSQPGGGVGQFAPVVHDSLSNGISPNLRDLPLAPRIHGPPYFANEVLPRRRHGGLDQVILRPYPQNDGVDDAHTAEGYQARIEHQIVVNNVA